MNNPFRDKTPEEIRNETVVREAALKKHGRQHNEMSITRDPATGRIKSDSNSWFQDETKLRVQFKTEARFNNVQTIIQGIDVYEDVEMVIIIPPVDLETNTAYLAIEKPVGDEEIFRFPKEYALFKEGKKGRVGTSLTLWKVLSPSQVKVLEANGFETVEQVAAGADDNLGSRMGLFGLKTKALQFLDAQKDAAGVSALQNELAKRDALMQGQQEQIATLMSQVQGLSAVANQAPKRPSRKPQEE
jgi:hypothetical protein